MLGVATNLARDALSEEALEEYNRQHADEGVVYEYDPEVLQTLADVAGMGQALIGLGATLTWVTPLLALPLTFMFLVRLT